MASHAIFQYNVLAIDDTHKTWTNICVKIIIIRLIGPRDEKDQNRDNLLSPVKPTIGKLYSPVQWTQKRQNQENTPDEPTRSRVKASVQ